MAASKEAFHVFRLEKEMPLYSRFSFQSFKNHRSSFIRFEPRGTPVTE
jgi:hypothetical protein